MLIPLDRITRNPNQPRETFPPEHIEQLAASIKARGLLQPISVRPIADGAYMIVAGECRYRAHQLLGADAIRAEVIDVDEREMQKLAIIENLQRHSMNPIEEARAFKSLRDNSPPTFKSLSRPASWPRRWHGEFRWCHDRGRTKC